MEKLDREIIEKYNNRLYMIIILMLVFVWVGFEIYFWHYSKQQKIQQDITNAQFEIRHKNLQDKLQMLQKKYAKEIQEANKAISINIYNLNYNDISLLAYNNYYESRGVGKKNYKQKRKDMENVTSVVLNRLESGKYGKTLQDVLQGAKVVKNGTVVCQFSWVCNNTRADINYKSREWKLAYEVAFEMYTGMTIRSSKKALHYYNPKKVQPRWAKKAKEVAYVSGGHRIIIID